MDTQTNHDDHYSLGVQDRIQDRTEWAKSIIAGETPERPEVPKRPPGFTSLVASESICCGLQVVDAGGHVCHVREGTDLAELADHLAAGRGGAELVTNLPEGCSEAKLAGLIKSGFAKLA